jgi:DeoR/GlpR family transcriptional regulator of sugar metabolism
MPPVQPGRIEERRARILEHIQQAGAASLAELAREHSVSTITVHRDLEQLTRQGLVERFHGGARATGAAARATETAWERRLRRAADAKDAIAAYARAMVADGATIFLDASSTAYALAHRLELEPPDDVTIVTTSPAIALGLDADGVRTIVAPGEVDRRMRAIGDSWTVEFLGRVKLDAAFISGSGLDLEHGLTTSRRQLADTLAAVRRRADATVALVDASKLGRSAMVTVARAQELDAVVVDAGADANEVAAYRAAGVRLEVAPALADDLDDGE